jgi:hypothetical protein
MWNVVYYIKEAVTIDYLNVLYLGDDINVGFHAAFDNM